LEGEGGDYKTLETEKLDDRGKGELVFSQYIRKVELGGCVRQVSGIKGTRGPALSENELRGGVARRQEDDREGHEGNAGGAGRTDGLIVGVLGEVKLKKLRAHEIGDLTVRKREIQRIYFGRRGHNLRVSVGSKGEPLIGEKRFRSIGKIEEKGDQS